jgi:arginyl-tRNA synthetase
VQEKNPELSPEVMGAVSHAVALGAIKYPMLSRDSAKVVTFDWETALDFNGQAAPYIQYAQVRANSILRRMDAPLPIAHVPGYELEPAEIQLIDLISRIPGEIQRSAKEYKPLYVASLAYELARAFNDFYMQCQVLKAEPEVREFRLRLVTASRQAIANLLRILGILSPEVM